MWVCCGLDYWCAADWLSVTLLLWAGQDRAAQHRSYWLGPKGFAYSGTQPVRNRGYTGPIKSRFDAVTNAHPARKLVKTLSHLFFRAGRHSHLIFDNTSKI
jgi:hypothetical protein